MTTIMTSFLRYGSVLLFVLVSLSFTASHGLFEKYSHKGAPVDPRTSSLK